MNSRSSAVFATLLTLAACESPTPLPSNKTRLGAVQVAVGGDVRDVPFAQITCTERRDITTVELHSTTQLADGQPRVLIARLRGRDVLEAHAFVPRATYEGHDYELAHVLAKAVDGAPQPDCRTEVADGATTLICNDATIIPWLAAGPRPRPSFKVTYRCD